MNRIAFLFFWVMLISQTSFAQKLKEGVITCETKIVSAEGATYPKWNETIFIKDGKSRSEYDNEGKWAIIVNPAKKEILSMGTPDHKTTDRMTFDEKTENQKLGYDSIVVETTNKTKDILGYKCSLVVLHYKGLMHSSEESRMEIWYTKEIAAIYPNYIFKQIDGFIMEYSQPSPSDPSNATETMTCTKVEKAKVADDKFVLPADCSEQLE